MVISDVWDGQKRKLFVHVCLQCGKGFLAPKKAQAKYCSVSCLRFRPRNSVSVECCFCKKSFCKKLSSLKNSKSGKFFCSRSCKDKGQSLSFGMVDIWPSHYGTGNGEYRNRISVESCIGCGDRRKFLLLVHHIDGSRENNSKENLECVCANCHIIRHLRLVDGKWLYWTKVLTPRDKLKDF